MRRLSKAGTRQSFVRAGVAGSGAALLLSLLLWFTASALQGLAFLSAERVGNNLGAILFLLVLGFIAVAEWPVMLFVMIRMARRGLPAPALLATHFTYTVFPAVYGALGTALTGERWWLPVMALLSLFRLSTSAVAIRPEEMAEREATRQAEAQARKSAPPPPDPSPPTHPRPTDCSLDRVQGFILDMDGVLYRGNTLRVGALGFIRFLNQRGIPYVCLTNNASRTSAMYQEKLESLGLPIDHTHVIGAAQAAAEWLAGHAAPGARVLPIGMAGLREELTRAGFTLVEQAPADFVVVGIDFDLTYERLKQAALAIRQRAQFIGTNPDTTFPSEEGLVPGNGATLAYLEAATGVTPTVIGKPHPAMMEVALAHLGLPHERVAMVGDRLNTDILGGYQAGLITILLRGGVTSDADLAHSALKPDHVFHDLGDLLDHYDRG